MSEFQFIFIHTCDHFLVCLRTTHTPVFTCFLCFFMFASLCVCTSFTGPCAVRWISERCTDFLVASGTNPSALGDQLLCRAARLSSYVSQFRLEILLDLIQHGNHRVVACIYGSLNDKHRFCYAVKLL